MATQVDKSSGEDLILPAALGIVFVVAAAAAVLFTQPMPTSQGAAEPIVVARESGEGADTSSAEASFSGDLQPVIDAINKGGCTACHTIPDIPNAVGQVGPDLSNVASNAATRREGYTAEEYIRESIREPNAFIAPDCPTGPCIAGTMPQVQLTDEEFEAIVGYLSTLD